ncbi:hypothetical protein DENSPDRAFT_838499 [Dentipellis sp. KUC8613]|nr:hypothetical protein DENSPDRAFT_838499 [Dentipellis sp. KUC8613]
MSAFLTSVPTEIIHEVVLHLPSTSDVLTCRVVCHMMKDALSAPVLYKRRLVTYGWDLKPWEDEEAENLTSEERLARWMRIDCVHSQVEELLNQACSQSNFKQMAEGINHPMSWIVANPSLWASHRRQPLSFLKLANNSPVVSWMVKMAKVLPTVVAHHASRNVNHLMQEAHNTAWLAILRTLDALALHNGLHSNFTCANRTYSIINAFERLGLCMAVLIPHCKADNLDVIRRMTFSRGPTSLSFLDPNGRYDSSFASFPQDIGLTWGRRLPDLAEENEIQRQTGACLIALTILYILIDSCDRHPGFKKLRAPSVPFMIRDTSDDWTLRTTVELEYGADWERPWLSERSMAPLLDKISDAGCTWGGYCSNGLYQSPYLDTPMLFTLKRQPFLPDEQETSSSEGEDSDASDSASDFSTDSGGPSTDEDGSDISLPDSPNNRIWFSGSGEDSKGTFQLGGSADITSGTVLAMKHYPDSDESSDWFGIITPFGMVGTCQTFGSGHWWWIWPKEWSEPGEDTAAA